VEATRRQGGLAHRRDDRRDRQGRLELRPTRHLPLSTRGTDIEARLVLTPADAPAAVALISELDAEIAERDPGEHRDPRLRFFLLTVGDATVGCGAIRRLEPGVAELKRMFVRRPFRRRGLSRTLLRRLEHEARRSGVRVLRLETGPRQIEALGLYRSAGYTEIARYGEYADSPDSICMEKPLTGRP
jgi:GNAT superfamily N-acetyltransferase